MASKQITLVVQSGAGKPAHLLGIGDHGQSPRVTADGSEVQRQFALMKARIIARYKLAAVPGRPEELVTPLKSGRRQLGVSMGYGCKTIRVRTMVGREWLDYIDFQIKEGWGSELYGFLDVHFGPPRPMASGGFLPTIARGNI